MFARWSTAAILILTASEPALAETPTKCSSIPDLTFTQAKSVVDNALLDIMLKVGEDNKKVYHVILHDGSCPQVFRFPITGNETVLDAIAQISGLPAICSKRKIWLTRPTPAKKDGCEILPVKWRAICEQGDTATNYTLCPGDRIHIAAAKPQPYKPVRIHGFTILQSGTTPRTTPPQ